MSTGLLCSPDLDEGYDRRRHSVGVGTGHRVLRDVTFSYICRLQEKWLQRAVRPQAGLPNTVDVIPLGEMQHICLTVSFVVSILRLCGCLGNYCSALTRS